MLLEFEKPIHLLEQKLASLKQEYELKKNDILHKAIEKLEEEIQKLTQEIFSNLTSWQRVQLARHPDRPYTLDFISNITDNFLELKGDRLGYDDPAIVGGFGDIDGKTFMLLGHQKGHTTKERQYRRFGMANPEGYRKALRLMKLAEKFEKPIVCFLDTMGAYPGIEAEERGQSVAIANNIQQMFTIKVPIIVIVIGEGASGGALGIGVGDVIYMFENTWYSIISPESCSAILWKTAAYKEEAADTLRLTAQDMYNMKLIDDIIPEPLGGAHKDAYYTALLAKEVILKSLKIINSDIQHMLDKRIRKFTTIGSFVQ